MLVFRVCEHVLDWGAAYCNYPHRVWILLPKDGTERKDLPREIERSLLRSQVEQMVNAVELSTSSE